MNEDTFNKIFAKRLNVMMKEKRLNQSDIARALDVSTTTVSNWCLGLKVPRAKRIDQLCDLFVCTRTDLIGDDVPHNVEVSIKYNLLKEEHQKEIDRLINYYLHLQMKDA